MGERGAKYSEDVGEFADQITEDLGELGEVTWRKMFGGAGVFVDDKMFALIDSEAVDAEKHSRMPYFAVPADVIEDHSALTDWASQSVAIARAG